ncbi:MAG: helix-turn-helix domain-containing protein [Lachnospiraceae bacterium]|nr:helix-turn-helix domain-containing protein [Lachnospiraceae bacterium]
MTLSREKIDIILARKGCTVSALCESVRFSRNRFYIVMNSKKISPKTAGRIAAALGVDVTEILED